MAVILSWARIKLCQYLSCDLVLYLNWYLHPLEHYFQTLSPSSGNVFWCRTNSHILETRRQLSFINQAAHTRNVQLSIITLIWILHNEVTHSVSLFYHRSCDATNVSIYTWTASSWRCGVWYQSSCCLLRLRQCNMLQFYSWTLSTEPNPLLRFLWKCKRIETLSDSFRLLTAIAIKTGIFVNILQCVSVTVWYRYMVFPWDDWKGFQTSPS